LDVVGFVHSMLDVNMSIRYVAVVDREYHLLASDQRENVPSFTPNETDRNFMTVVPPLIVDAVERLMPFLGEMEAISVRYEKALLTFHRSGNLVIVMSFGPGVLTPFLSQITREFEKRKSEFLT
jgi:hypothetical protein